MQQVARVFARYVGKRGARKTRRKNYGERSHIAMNTKLKSK
jgi:hypothetical protein